ncbi:hypothetical protein LNP25_26865 [Klebsiella variicola subsp. variicola]|nr:hypothetical protein [Klebsiella variicola subsp. variicola]
MSTGPGIPQHPSACPAASWPAGGELHLPADASYRQLRRTHLQHHRHQSLINAGVANPDHALRNGTIGWTLAGQSAGAPAAAAQPIPPPAPSAPRPLNGTSG